MQQSENSYILVPTVSQVALSVKIGQDATYISPALIAVSPIITWSYYTWVGEDRTGLNL